ncbi:ABR116Cp [Eremothecium gossypii ATCC 10895]|uniref:Saccharopine dehydrogenase [NADP(+), L-glutamate-forming] n=1 Tax=Eremothecium gossypii (strain ATCC 10895 / CBS 109.51 / FGSC 9923 / NRRL Y-1056) TaxID=284811 RepID=Q75DA8_EREGS|nr:ABR116Cp [Eremothecium gossypii ATCC 10895]AAS50887.1 ABR116Cp [Eremothecium gossypii ATCC 10895]
MVKKVLVLGSGFVAKPVVDVLDSTDGIEVTVGCRTLAKAKALTAGTAASAISVDASDSEGLDAAVGEHDVVVSLIPYIHHADVVRAAIRQRKHVVTTSYISPALRALEPEIKAAGITVMNEIGLDPGIDHLYAVKIIDEVHRAGGKINSFLSYCGGLPAPEDSDNPLGYKFSWSARGLLLALKNQAQFWKDGSKQVVKSEDLMASAEPYFIMPGYAFVCYPNRDSTVFRDLYGIPEAKTVIRGTLRYQGFPEFVKVLVDMGLLKEEPHSAFTQAQPWSAALAAYLGAKSASQEHLVAAIDARTSWKSQADRERIIAGLSWLGLLSDELIAPAGNPLDALCASLEQRMQYEEGERDMVCLQHKFDIEWADGSTETRTATLIDYGRPSGYSSMAATVGYPCAIATRLVLEGAISGPGLIAPYTPEVIEPIMRELKDKYGIYMKEKTT